MLKSIQLENFKSYQKQVLPLAPLTLMIGANASGKSNALEAIRFLSWLSEGQKLSVLKFQIDDSEQVVRGQVKDLCAPFKDSFTLSCITDDHEWNQFEVTIEVREGELHISDERIIQKEEKIPLYWVKEGSSGLNNDIRVAYNNFARGGRKPEITCNDQIAVMCQLVSAAMFESGHRKTQQKIPQKTALFQNLLSNMLFLDPVPSKMRSDSLPDKKLRSDCANLSGVLYRLWQDPDNQQKIISFIQSLPEQDVKTLSFFEPNRKGEVSFELVETFGGTERKCSVELLSDGTLRVLAIAVALLASPEGATVVIEEVDNGVHPSRAKQLLTSMRELAEQRNIRLLLSTHNPALMDALPDEALGDVVFCYRDPLQGDSRLIRLADLEDYPGLILQGPLGELVTQGVVDRFVKSPITAEEKKQNAMDWLARMQGDDQ